MQATLYTPRIVHAGDNLPAILVTHGTSCSNSTVNGVAEELASRGFVVLSLSAYGSGSSETQDVGDPRMDPSLGIYDGLQYLRTLQYIDKTRIGMVGHSQGSKNVAAAVDMDCSLYTLNDLMLNVLSETFGQSFTLEEISQDADELAAQRLSADQLVHYQAIRAEKEQLSKRQRALETKADRLRQYLSDWMTAAGRDKLETPRLELRWRKSTAVVVDDLNSLPEACRKVRVEADKAVIRKLIQLGDHLEGAHLEETRNLQIR